MTEIVLKSEIDVELIQHMGSDALIAGAAWASRNAREALERARTKPDDVPGVINYLVKHRHGTPFEHNGMTFFVHAPIFVWREWHRHRIGFSYNEESARYKQLDPVFYFPARDRPMMKVDGWKPGRPKFIRCESDYAYHTIVADMADGYRDEYARYERQWSRDIDPGLARDNLPVGIYSGCWVTCNARSAMAFLSLRTHEPDAKFVSYPLYEIDAAARKVETAFAGLFPVTYKAFCDNGRVSP